MRRFDLFPVLLVLTPVFLIPAAAEAQITTAATFGKAIALPGGTPSDIVLDEPRQRLYLVNTNDNRVDIYGISNQQLVGSVGVGSLPLAAAISMDGSTLYVTNSKSSTVSVIDLGRLQVIQTVSLPAVPEGVEVGVDGRALITTRATSSLLIFDPTQTGGQQLTPVPEPPAPSTPAPLQGQTLTRPQTTFYSKLIRTADGQYIIGLTNPTTTQTYLFVYEVLSGTILRSRTVTGQSTVLSIAPDGSRFMAGYTMYDTATLSVIAQQNNANAPFTFSAAFNTQQNVGGSVFTSDGNTIYSAFNVAAASLPAPRPSSSTLLVSDSRNLGIQLGIRLPESIVARMVITSDGSNAWSLSQSGMIHLPLSDLYTYPIIQPDQTQVFLSSDPCSRGVATGTVKINNLGGGKLTYSINNLNQALVTQVTSGVAPSTIQFTMDPGRANVNRQSGTNLYTGGQTVTGYSLDINLASNEAINIPNTVHVYMNQRDPDQRGLIYPLPTLTNNSPASAANPVFNPGGNEGLYDIVLDQGRNRVYIANSALNRIEIFDTVNRIFLDPIIVGQLPHQMALSTDSNTLYVGATGGELISIVDLTQNPPAFTGYINFPPLPRQASGTNAAVNSPRSLAYGLFGLEFIMSNGGQWKLSTGNIATVRPADSITTVGTSSNFTPPTTMIASTDGVSILTLAGTGEAFLYDATTDSYVSAAQLIPTTSLTSAGYFGPLAAAPGGAYFVVGGQILNSSLTPLPSSGNPTASSTQRNYAAVYPLDQNNFVAFTTSYRSAITASSADEQRPTLQLINVNTGQTTLLGVTAEQPRWTVFGTARTNIPPRLMVVDASGTAYILTLSGLSVVPLTINGAATPVLNAVRPATGTALSPGTFINVTGSGLATSETANVLPAPTVLGGSCVTFNDVSLPLLKAADGTIQAQIPANVLMGSNVVVVRSLATGQYSNSIVVNVQSGGTN